MKVFGDIYPKLDKNKANVYLRFVENTILTHHLIDQYREVIKLRYNYNRLDNTYVLSDSITEERVNDVRTYFLNYIYPDADTRNSLNKGFAGLKRHINNPGHIIRILGDATTIMFKFGFQFPKAIQAGLRSLESYNAATTFEKGLYDAAIKMNLEIPFSLEEFENCIAHLPKKDVEHFISEFDELLKAITNTSLLEKTVEILSELTEKMKEHPKVYNEDDIQGMEIGVSILENGYKLFIDFSEDDKKEMIHFIKRVEQDEIDRIFETYNANNEA